MAQVSSGWLVEGRNLEGSVLGWLVEGRNLEGSVLGWLVEGRNLEGSALSTRSLSSKLSFSFPLLSYALKYSMVRTCSLIGLWTSPRVILTAAKRSRDWME